MNSELEKKIKKHLYSFDDTSFSKSFSVVFEDDHETSYIGKKKETFISHTTTQPVKSKDEHLIEESLALKSGFIANERWTQTVTFDAKIISINPANVTCELLIDKEQGIFEKREFSAYHFSHFKAEAGRFVWIKVQSKPGSTRTDIIDAKDFIDTAPFSLDNGWEDDPEFGAPLKSKW